MSNGNEARIQRRGSGQDEEDYLEVSFKDGGERRLAIFPARDLASMTALRSIGIVTNASRNAFMSEAEAALHDMPATFDVADRSGWLNGMFV